MIPAVNTFKIYPPLIFTGGGTAMLASTLAFDAIKFLIRESKAEKKLAIKEHDKLADNDNPTPYQKYVFAVNYAITVGTVVAVATHVLLLSSRLILRLSLKEKQFVFLNQISKTLSQRVPDLNVICAFITIAIKALSVGTRVIASDFFDDEESKKSFFTLASESAVRINATLLAGFMGAGLLFLIQKYFPET